MILVYQSCTLNQLNTNLCGTDRASIFLRLSDDSNVHPKLELLKNGRPDKEVLNLSN